MASTPSVKTRPRQVETGCWAVIVGSIGMVLFAFQRVSTLGSTEFQDTVRSVLADQPSGMGLDLATVTTLVRVLSFVCAAIALVSLGFAWEARAGSRRGRLGVTLAAPVLVVLGSAVSLASALVVVVGVSLLWLEAPRAWYGSGSAAPNPNKPTLNKPTPTPSATAAPGPPTAGPYGQTPPAWGGTTSLPGTASAPAPPSTSGYVPAPRADRRPREVLLACVVTWTACGVVGALAALTLLVTLTDTAALLDQLRPSIDDAGLSDHQFVVAARIGTAVVVGWSALGALLALAVFHRQAWARVALLVCATVAGVACVATLLSAVVTVLPLAACVVAVANLLRTPVAEWLRAR